MVAAPTKRCLRGAQTPMNYETLAAPPADLPGAPESSRFFSLLRQRILHKYDGNGWEGLVTRVERIAAEAEDRWGESDRSLFVERLGHALRSGEFLPNSPLLVNCSEARRALHACFVVDSRRPTADFLRIVREIHDGMGGVGYSLDGTAADSAADFIRLVDHDTVLHQEGRPRPASSGVTASIDAPDSDAVFQLSGTLQTTSLNVGISDNFMARLDDGDETAAEKFTLLARTIHSTGQPGVLFTDRIQRISRNVEAPFASNVCGEAPLAADESGVLGSINLLRFLEPDGGGGFTFDETRFADVTRLAVRFLDGMLDLHRYAYSELGLNSLATRKIGVGIMGFAHFLSLLGIRYGDRASIMMATRVGSLLSSAARKESERLGQLRGSFPAWRADYGMQPRRNAALTAIAATSTLALLVGTTGGIEPVFSHVTKHRVIGDTIVVLDRVVELFGAMRGIASDVILGRLTAGEPLARILGADVARLVPIAHEISGEDQIEIQAAFQREIDGGISKTLNCSAGTSVNEISRWLRLAYRRDCMGLTIFRDGARSDQPMVRGS